MKEFFKQKQVQVSLIMLALIMGFCTLAFFSGEDYINSPALMGVSIVAMIGSAISLPFIVNTVR